MLLPSQDNRTKQRKNDSINTVRSCRRSNQKSCSCLTTLPHNRLSRKGIMGSMAKIQNRTRKSNVKPQKNLYKISYLLCLQAKSKQYVK